MLTHTFHITPWWRWRTLLPFFFSALLLVARPGHAAAQAAVQVGVSIRDGADRGMDQVAISLHTRDGALVSQGVTDRAGFVTLAVSVPVPTVLQLLVQGVTATGTPLQLAASERAGIVIHLNGPQTALALRVEDDGTVVPDPATMAEPDGAPLAATPPAPSLVPATPPAAHGVLLAPTPAANGQATTVPPVVPTAAPPVARTVAPVEFIDANGQRIVDPPPARSATVLPWFALLLISGIIVAGIWIMIGPVWGGQR